MNEHATAQPTVDKPGSAKPDYDVKDQAHRYASPWTLGHRIKTAIWVLVCMVLFRPTPKPCNPWRLLLLKLFGAEIHGTPFVDASCDIKYPWHLTLHDRACIGPRADIYNLGRITLREGCTVAQQVYLCTGTHDLEDIHLPLVTAPIEIGANAFVGVRALVMPGVTIGEGAVVGGGSVVTKSVAPWTIVAGNPAKALKERKRFEGTGDAGS